MEYMKAPQLPSLVGGGGSYDHVVADGSVVKTKSEVKSI